MIFQEKCFSCHILLTDKTSLSYCLNFLRYWDNLCVVIVCNTDCDIMNFETNLIFLIKLFFYMTKKSRQKLKYLENEMSF